jgi:hypothetical protein
MHAHDEDRRTMQRFPIRLLTVVETPDGPTRMYTKDISYSGAYLYGSLSLETGTSLRLEFYFDSQGGEKLFAKDCRIRTSGHVVRVDEAGFGVEFVKQPRLIN